MKTDKPIILYVDDELNNLTGFKATFRRDYKVLTAQSASEAREILRENEPQIIISDQRMPGETGVEFFKSIIDEYPKPVRMLLTGYADIEAVIKAINDGNVYRYITKPWEENDLKLTIESALQFYNTQNELRERNIELEKAYSELEKFVYSASHDLRAPLVSVMGILKLAKMEQVNEIISDYLNKIETSVGKLDVLLQNIINYYRSEKLVEQQNEINFENLFRETLEGLEHYEHADQIKFSVDVEQNGVFKADEARLKIVLNNIISNAIKYQRSEESDKQIGVRAKAVNGLASIEISDNGIGIEPECFNDIFTMFYHSKAKNAGSGIGLYIVKETLAKLDASIEVDSIPGQGSKFTIKIPNHANN